MAKRKKRRHRGAAGKANADLDAHIQSLGLETVNQYQAWCREHGLNGALNKSWQERRQERKLVEQAAEQALADKELMRHIHKLGLLSVDDYVAWCSEQGLSTGTNKSQAQRKKECDLAVRLQSDVVLAQMKNHTRRPQDTLQALYEGTLRSGELNRPYLKKIKTAFDQLGRDKRARKALLDLLLVVEKRGDLFDTKPALSRLGSQDGNTFIEALGALASWHKHWLRDSSEWRPDSHNARKQFGSLARHLLTRYDVPVFMDGAWFLGDVPDADIQQKWFVQVGMGTNIRKAEIPLTLTKKMAHLFLNAPDDYSIYEAFRWGQILGLGGEESLVRAVNGTQLGRSFENEDFWHTVVHFFVNNPMLDPDEVGPIVDYIQNQKYEIREEEVDGETVELPPLQPNFSIKARSMNKLLHQMEMWHRGLNKRERLPSRVWAPSGLEPLEWKQTNKYGQALATWTITEILNTRELSAEGRAMHHCVGSYAKNCKNGNISVWSMQVKPNDEDEIHRVMTIAVQNQSNSISQARGKCNALPSGKTPSGKRTGFNKEYERYLRRSRQVLFLWREREGLSMGRGV